MSRQVDATEQGRLQGAVTGLTSLAGIFAPFLFASLFAAVIRPQAVLHLPGASFLLSSLIVVAAGVVAWRVTAARSPAAG
jgi:DHA1 family tetracycline resistance protein-like MFS transporter